MKILFVWTGVTSYMADCWRELQRLEGVELKVIVEDVESGHEFNRDSVLRGLDANIDGWRPDVIFAVGWHSRIVRGMVTRADWRDIPKVCCFDLPWRWLPRCIAAKFVLHRFLCHYSAAYVPGAASARYAKWLGFDRVYRGLFGIDVGKFAKAVVPGRRTGFLYVGRNSPEKRIDLIRKAYGMYREAGGGWTIDFYGGNAFVSPEAMPGVYAAHACLVLASAFDPWPLVAIEAKAAGCEVIMSDRCGNRFELATRTVKYGDALAMAKAMLAVEREGLTACGQSLDEWDCKTWATRTLAIAKEVVS